MCVSFLTALQLQNFLQNNRYFIASSSLSTRPLPSRPNGFLISNDPILLTILLQSTRPFWARLEKALRDDFGIASSLIHGRLSSSRRQLPPVFDLQFICSPPPPAGTLSLLATNIRSCTRCPQVTGGKGEEIGHRNARPERCIVRRQVRWHVLAISRHEALGGSR